MNTCTCGGPLAPTDPTHPADHFCVRCAATYTNGQRVVLSRQDVAAGIREGLARAHG